MNPPKLSNTILADMQTKSAISIGQALAAREDLLILAKTSSGAARIETAINKHTMKGNVADRGGRVTELNGPQRETFQQQEQQRNMPQWSKRQEPPPGQQQQRGGGRGGGNRGRGANRGGNRGGGGKYGSTDSNLTTREYYNSGYSRGGHRGGFKRGSFSS